MSKSEICSRDGTAEGLLMLMPARLDWYDAGAMCRLGLEKKPKNAVLSLNQYLRRFGGRLHVDDNTLSVSERSFPLVAAGELLKPDRCHRVWLGASDVEEEGVWRDSETRDILDIREFWGPGQPNGVRVQNCAGIWELVS